MCGDTITTIEQLLWSIAAIIRVEVKINGKAHPGTQPGNLALAEIVYNRSHFVMLCALRLYLAQTYELKVNEIKKTMR